MCLAGCKSEKAGNATNQVRATELATDQLSIKTQDGKTHIFKVEIARTPEEQKRGLQFRDSIAADAAMVFPLDPPRTQSMWMENTLISLDILFVRMDGTIESIAADMVPQSREPRSSNEPVSAVVEIKGGEAARRNISAGDVIRWAGLPK